MAQLVSRVTCPSDSLTRTPTVAGNSRELYKTKSMIGIMSNPSNVKEYNANRKNHKWHQAITLLRCSSDSGNSSSLPPSQYMNCFNDILVMNNSPKLTTFTTSTRNSKGTKAKLALCTIGQTIQLAL